MDCKLCQVEITADEEGYWNDGFLYLHIDCADAIITEVMSDEGSPFRMQQDIMAAAKTRAVSNDEC